MYPAAKIPDWIFYQGKSTSTNFDRHAYADSALEKRFAGRREVAGSFRAFSEKLAGF
jgi:hypothetical protein